MTWIIITFVLCLLHSMFIKIRVTVTCVTAVTPLVSLVTDDVDDTDIGRSPGLINWELLRLSSSWLLLGSLSLSRQCGAARESLVTRSSALHARQHVTPGPARSVSGAALVHLEGTLFSFVYWLLAQLCVNFIDPTLTLNLQICHWDMDGYKLENLVDPYQDKKYFCCIHHSERGYIILIPSPLCLRSSKSLKDR